MVEILKQSKRGFVRPRTAQTAHRHRGIGLMHLHLCQPECQKVVAKLVRAHKNGRRPRTVSEAQSSTIAAIRSDLSCLLRPQPPDTAQWT
jgi:hypothetical protein